jgi:hypothetical protein
MPAAKPCRIGDIAEKRAAGLIGHIAPEDWLSWKYTQTARDPSRTKAQYRPRSDVVGATRLGPPFRDPR